MREGTIGKIREVEAGEEQQERWDGGFVRYDRRGRPTFIIRQMIDGHRYVMSTRCHDKAAAMVHYRRFQENPEAYRPEGAKRKAPVYLDDDLHAAFIEWSAKPEKDGGAGNVKAWVHQQDVFLEWWKERLRGVDLRRASLREHILPALAGVASRSHRIHVLKRFFSWLVSVEHKIEPAEDCTYRTLSAPKSAPKEVQPFPVEHFALVRVGLHEPWRSVFVVQGGTGMHATEVVRFAVGGRIEKPNKGRTDGAAAVLYIPRHKNGLPYRVAVSAKVARAAQVVLDHGTFDPRWYAKQVAAACKNAGIHNITSRLMRHTVISNAITKGETIQKTGEYAGHSDVKTTRIYGQLAPPKIPTLI